MRDQVYWRQLEMEWPTQCGSVRSDGCACKFLLEIESLIYCRQGTAVKQLVANRLKVINESH